MTVNNEKCLIKINSDELQVLQDAFCQATDMYVMSMSREHGPITYFSGSVSESDFLGQHFSMQLRQELLDSFVDGDAENIILREASQDYIMYSAVAIRGENGIYLGAWLCFGIDQDALPDDVFLSTEIKRTSRKAYEKGLSLLEALTKSYVAGEMKANDLLKNLSDQQDAGKLLEHRLLKNEIMTEILRMMESENSFSKISEDIVKEAGQYLGASHVNLLKLSPDEATVDMITEWCRSDAEPMIARCQHMSRQSLPFMNGKPYTISNDSILPEAFATFFNQVGIDAGIFLPIEVDNDSAMYLCFLSAGDRRKWSVDDLRFANDIKRVLHTILIKRITKNSLASSYSALEAILQNTGCGVAVSDVKRRQNLYTNDTFKAMFENEIDRLAVEELLFDPEENPTALTGYAANGSGKFYNVAFSTFNWVDGRQVRLSTFYDVSELKSYQKRIEKQASEDLLTGLYNRQKCEKDLDAELHYAMKTEKKFAVLMLDLDDFNNVNEGLGHQNGDSLLKFIAHAINDIAQVKGKCYRVGGDEFIVLVDHEVYDKLDLVIARITNLFDNPWLIENKEFYCTMSMGGVKAPQDADDVAAIFTSLNIALHEAKKNGKNRFVFYDSETDSTATERLEKEKAMRNAVEEGCKEFLVYYQPIIEIKKDNTPCCGAEALVRWDSKELGFLNPGDFIGLAEYLGLINQIGQHVLYEAARRCKHWNDFGHPEYKVNVNLSMVQLTQTDIVETVRKVLADTAIDPHNLTLEITESLMTEETEKIIKVLSDLRALGCRVALDDFGTGYSSLSRLKDFPLDTIKIDRSFVKDIAKDSFYGAFIKSVSDLASALDLDVCCEGIENEKQLEQVNKYSVNVAQGYLFDKPLPLAEFEERYLS